MKTDLPPYPEFTGTPRASQMPMRRTLLVRRHKRGGPVLPARFRLWLLRRAARPRRVVDSVRLLQLARDLYPGVTLADVTHESMLDAVTTHGIDQATAWLIHLIRTDPASADANAAMDAIDPSTDPLPKLRGRLLIIPASLYEELPEFGGDGLMLIEAARTLGIDARLISMPGVCQLDEGVAHVRRALDEELARDSESPLILCSLCRGGGEVRTLLERDGLPDARRFTWINVAGLLHGTPLFTSMANPRGFKRRMAVLQFSLLGIPRGPMIDYAHGDDGLLGSDFKLPEGLDVISLIPMPFTTSVSADLAGRHRRLGARGPNDGTNFALDAFVPGTITYPVVDGDHYFRSPSAAWAVWRLLIWLGATGRFDHD